MMYEESTALSGPDQILPATSLKCWEPDGAVQLQMAETGPQSEQPVSVYTFLSRVANQYPLQHALAVKKNGKWIFWTYEEYFAECCTVAKAFIALGLERFHGVCIMGFNAPQWLIANFACIFAGGISTGIYTTNSPEVCQHLANDCRAQILVLENQRYVDKFMTVKEKLPNVKAIVQWTGTPDTPGVMSWQELLDLGRKQEAHFLNDRLKRQAVNQCCTLIYTSGTTGPPKGVMCSQDNLTWCGIHYSRLTNLQPCSEHFVSYLPLSHLAAQMTELYVSIPVASTIYFAEPDALKGSLGKTLVEVQPTEFLGVPRVWEKIYEKMQEVAKNSSTTTKAVSKWAKQLSSSYYTALQKGKFFDNGRGVRPKSQTYNKYLSIVLSLGMLESTQFALARWLVFSRVKAALGFSRTHNMVSGSAPMNVEVFQYFLSLDLPIMECYGLSESLSLGSICKYEPGGFKLGSVGKVMHMIEMKLQESAMSSGKHEGEGEICMKGRNVFMGYLNQKDKTNETITDDGWLHTGDLGWFDSDGFLYITGRVKELVITAGGENIPPVIIEETIQKKLPELISNSILIGDKRKYLTILLTVRCLMNEDTAAPLDTLAPSAAAWCAQHDLSVTSVSEFIKVVDSDRSGPTAKAIQSVIEWYNEEKAISNAQKVQRWMFLPHDFSVATGELNSTLKLKRSVTAQMYSKEIDLMYSDNYPGLSA